MTEKKDTALTAAAPAVPDVRTVLEKANDLYLPMVANQLSTHGIEMDSVQKQCVMNALETIGLIARENDFTINDIDRPVLSSILQRVAALRLDAFSIPRKVYFTTRNVKRGDKWVKTVEMGVEGAGNEDLVRNFGVDVKTVHPCWLVRENDEFKYPRYVGIQMNPPEWEPHGEGKVIRVVYPITYKDDHTEYHISERADVRKNLVAHVSNNLMNETFGIAESRYKATVDQKRQIDEKKEEIKKLMDGKSMEEILVMPELQKYISPAWKEGHSSESMIITKMKNNALKPIPKDFHNAFASSAAYHAEQEETRYEVAIVQDEQPVALPALEPHEDEPAGNTDEQPKQAAPAPDTPF